MNMQRPCKQMNMQNSTKMLEQQLCEIFDGTSLALL